MKQNYPAEFRRKILRLQKEARRTYTNLALILQLSPPDGERGHFHRILPNRMGLGDYITREHAMTVLARIICMPKLQATR